MPESWNYSRRGPVMTKRQQRPGRPLSAQQRLQLELFWPTFFAPYPVPHPQAESDGGGADSGGGNPAGGSSGASSGAKECSGT